MMSDDAQMLLVISCDFNIFQYISMCQAHKQESGCTGKRPRTERVAPLNAFTDCVSGLRGHQGTLFARDQRVWSHN